ncbi:MAG TPA: hypothetical protein VJ862_00445 [Rhodanobacteraceae bacterium]|nr:hypothetical protein [Rhodanobacteraceae bacterium]
MNDRGFEQLQRFAAFPGLAPARHENLDVVWNHHCRLLCAES